MVKSWKYVFCNENNVCEVCPYMEECFDQVLKELKRVSVDVENE